MAGCREQEAGGRPELFVSAFKEVRSRVTILGLGIGGVGVGGRGGGPEFFICTAVHHCIHRLCEGLRVLGSGFRVQGSGFRLKGAGFRVQGSGFRSQGSG